jgi:V8-like Glu-specific endopeptidase
MFKFCYTLLTLLILCGVSEAQVWNISPNKSYHNSVVKIIGDGREGSGTVVKYVKDAGDHYVGLILTASHCVASPTTKFNIYFRNGKISKEGKPVFISSYFFDRYSDIAIIEALIPDEIKPMEISTEKVKINETVEICGYATGKLRHWNATYGGHIHNSRGHVVFSWAIQGDSGGPIIYKGKVIGVTCFGTAVSKYNERLIVAPIHGTDVIKLAGIIDSYTGGVKPKEKANTKVAFKEEKDEDLMVLQVGAKWCPPCNKLKAAVKSSKTFQAFIKTSTEGYFFIDVDSKDPTQKGWANLIKAKSYPTVVIFKRKDGKWKEQVRFEGYRSPDSILSLLKRYI